MGRLVVSNEANPGAKGSGLTTIYANAAGQLCYVGNDAVEHPMPFSASAVATAAARKTADQSLTAQTALQNDTQLTFDIAASEEWVAEFSLDAGAALATTGIKLGVTAPAGATLNVSAALLPDVIAAANLSVLRTVTAGAALDFTASGEVGVGDAAIKVSVWVLNGATPGAVRLQFAQSTSSATALLLRKGSAMIANRVA